MNCKNCKWAKWQRNKLGRIKNLAGQCTVDFKITDAPYSVMMSRLFNPYPHKSAIWPKDEFDNCPQYEEKPKDEKP